MNSSVVLNQRNTRIGVVLVLLSAVLNSFGGLLVRNMEEASEWDILFYRNLSLFVAIVVLMIMQHGKKAAKEASRVGLWGVLGGVAYGIAAISYLSALTHTTVANTVFTMSAIPFFTALLAWLFLKEQVSRSTWVAMAFAMGGVAIMLADGFGSGSFYGNFAALLTALSYASFVVIMRRSRTTNMLPSTAIGGLIAVVLAWINADGTLIGSQKVIVICILWGCGITFVSHWLVNWSKQYLTGADLTLLMLAEFILGPIWVWAFINEIPTLATLVGGAVVLTAVTAKTILSVKSPAS